MVVMLVVGKGGQGGGRREEGEEATRNGLMAEGAVEAVDGTGVCRSVPKENRGSFAHANCLQCELRGGGGGLREEARVRIRR